MKIGFITSGGLPMPPVNGGAVENLIQTFIDKNEINQDHELYIFGPYNKLAKQKSYEYKKCTYIYINEETVFNRVNKGVRFYINKLPHIYVGNHYISEVCKALDDTIDIIIVENRPEYILPLKKVFSGKIVLHLHNDLLNNQTKLNEKIFSLYDCIFTVSDYINKRVASICESEKVITLYNGIDNELFITDYSTHKKVQILNKYKITDNDTVVLYSGRINAAKGVKELMEVFVDLPKNLKVKLIIVGSSIYGKTVKDKFLLDLQLIASKRKEDIIFTGYIDYNDIPLMHSIADIIVVPSMWEDPSPLTVYEALASGSALIVSDSGGIPEIVGDNAAIIIERGKEFNNNFKIQLENLINSKEKRRQLSIKAKERSEKFDSKIYYDNFNLLLKKVITKREI